MHYVGQTPNRPSAQGDVQIIKIDALPEEAVVEQTKGGCHIVAHGGSGHHAIKASEGVRFYSHKDNNLRAYIEVDNTAVIEHMRSYDTHAPLGLNPGVYEVRRQIESAPEGFRRAID